MNKVGVYTRISRSKDNSYNESISNQIEGIKRYCDANSFNIIKIYKDIGYSGSNFNRPGYIEMLNDMDNGIINTIIVKDLSRLGRDHLVVGKLLEEDLLINDIRLIAIDDNYDNKNKIDEFVAFRNIFNELYLKDLKKKMQSSINHKAKTKLLNQRKGAFYGLKEEGNKLIIDEEPANVVKLIFKLSSEDNYGDAKIAKILTNMNIINPSHYRYNKYNEKANLTENPYYWSATTIRNILLNEGYTGKIINQKYKNVNGKTIVNNNPIIIENGLPQIISEEIFVKSYENRKSHKRYSEPSDNNKYKNFIYCEKCNKAMRYSFVNTMNKYSYHCIRCNNRIYEDKLNSIINEELDYILNSLDLSNIKNIEEILINKHIISSNKDINKFEKRLKKLNNELDALYEDYLLGNINEKLFVNEKEKLENDIRVLEQETKQVMLKEKVVYDYYNEINNYINGFNKLDTLFIKVIANKISINKIDRKEYDIIFDYKISI